MEIKGICNWLIKRHILYLFKKKARTVQYWVFENGTYK